MAALREFTDLRGPRGISVSCDLLKIESTRIHLQPDA